jgi:hypothetical protein
MKFIYAALSVLGLALLGVYVWKPIRVQTYLLPSTLKPGWVTIEYENSKCNPLKEDRLRQEHVIPESGYLCTLSRRETKWVYRRYYLVQANGERRPLTEGKEIFQEGTLFLDPGNPDCKVTADSFWYGPQEQIDNQRHEVLKQHHPECNKGLVTPIK